MEERAIPVPRVSSVPPNFLNAQVAVHQKHGLALIPALGIILQVAVHEIVESGYCACPKTQYEPVNPAQTQAAAHQLVE